MRALFFLLAASGIFALASCGGFEKQVDINLPKVPKQLVVECYLMRNQPVQVAVSETQDYFGTYTLPFINDATVTLSYNGHTDTIPFAFPILNLINPKYFNYRTKDSIPLQKGITYSIRVQDKQGRVATAETHWIDPVPIDTIRTNVHDTSYNIVMSFRDPSLDPDYYRFQVVNLSDSNRVRADYFADDGIFNGQKSSFGTGYRFGKGNQVQVTLYHLPKEYYDFLKTAVAAENANGNPFAQPSTLISNVKGGLGIFTTLPFSRKIVEIK